jgi:2-polyprenyl-3-methyl-5-hydroxy-6-metoxy-1,4-benzoquinol methylase
MQHMADRSAAPIPDPGVAALVEAQWREHDRMLSLPAAVRAAITERDLAELVASTPLQPDFREWSGHTPQTLRLYAAPSNHARLAWLINAVDNDERIIDIGPGSGSIAGRIISTKRPRRYAAIEPSAAKVTAFHGMAGENAIDRSAYELHQGTAEDVVAVVIADVQPTLILLLEVLEHVHDPAGLLTHVAAAMPEDSDLLISVPILGRIEHEWGHRSVFDRTRLERLAAAAGLVVHWIEPIADLWLFLLLSKSSAIRPRVARLSIARGSATRVAVSEPSYFFRQVPLPAETAWLRSGAGREVSAVVEVGEFSVIRLRASADGATQPKSVDMEFTHQQRPIERWALTPSEIQRAVDGTATWVFRRGCDHGRDHQDLEPSARPDGCRITLAATSRRAAEIELQRAEVIGWVSDPVDTVAPAYAPRLISMRVLASRALRRGRRFVGAARRSESAG